MVYVSVDRIFSTFSALVTTNLFLFGVIQNRLSVSPNCPFVQKVIGTHCGPTHSPIIIIIMPLSTLCSVIHIAGSVHITLTQSIEYPIYKQFTFYRAAKPHRLTAFTTVLLINS